MDRLLAVSVVVVRRFSVILSGYKVEVRPDQSHIAPLPRSFLRDALGVDVPHEQARFSVGTFHANCRGDKTNWLRNNPLKSPRLKAPSHLQEGNAGWDATRHLSPAAYCAVQSLGGCQTAYPARRPRQRPSPLLGGEGKKMSQMAARKTGDTTGKTPPVPLACATARMSCEVGPWYLFGHLDTRNQPKKPRPSCSKCRAPVEQRGVDKLLVSRGANLLHCGGLHVWEETARFRRHPSSRRHPAAGVIRPAGVVLFSVSAHPS